MTVMKINGLMEAKEKAPIGPKGLVPKICSVLKGQNREKVRGVSE